MLAPQVCLQSPLTPPPPPQAPPPFLSTPYFPLQLTYPAVHFSRFHPFQPSARPPPHSVFPVATHVSPLRCKCCLPCVACVFTPNLACPLPSPGCLCPITSGSVLSAVRKQALCRGLLSCYPVSPLPFKLAFHPAGAVCARRLEPFVACLLRYQPALCLSGLSFTKGKCPLCREG